MIKGRNAKEKIEYFWTYEKGWLIAILVVIVVAVGVIQTAAASRTLALSVMLIDSHPTAVEEDMEEEYATIADIDASSEEVLIQTALLFSDSNAGNYAMTSMSKFYADIGTQKLDVAGMWESDFTKYTNTDCFLDLRDYFTDEELEHLKDSLYLEGSQVLGIYADALPVLQEQGCYTGGEQRGVIGIIYNTEHIDQAVHYIKYLAGFES